MSLGDEPLLSTKTLYSNELAAVRSTKKEEVPMDMIVVLIILLLLFGGGGGLYWGMGAGWGIGPVGLIIAVLVIAFLLNGRRGGRRL
jgi:uncharacterized membrane protein